MPKIDLVDVMKKAPGRCLCCNTTPTEGGKPQVAIDLNVDVDWGNNAYLCNECATVICDLLGRVPVEDHEILKRDLRRLNKDHRRLRKQFRRVGGELKALAAGKKIERRVKKRKAA